LRLPPSDGWLAIRLAWPPSVVGLGWDFELDRFVELILGCEELFFAIVRPPSNDYERG
jgi:hypothetical protein